MVRKILKKPERNPLDIEYNYYQDLWSHYMAGDKVNLFCYELARTRVDGTCNVSTFDDLMYAWDHFEPAHMDKRYEEALIALKKYTMVDAFKLSGDWSAKSIEDKKTIALEFKIGPYLEILKDVVSYGVIADEVWLAWGLDPPEEESFCGFGSDDDLFW